MQFIIWRKRFVSKADGRYQGIAVCSALVPCLIQWEKEMRQAEPVKNRI